MERLPFVLRFGQETAQKPLSDAERETLLQTLAAAGAENFSIWQIEDFWFCYGEYSKLRGAEAAAQALCAVAGAELFAAPGTLPLMYHCIGLVRADKSHIRHRVFSTRLKEGCAAEYKRRLDALIEARHGVPSPGPDSNFTIWNANGYIFGYDEIDTAYRPDPSLPQKTPEEEKADTIAWETRQLEIMDWLTDDVDWLTGQKHAPSRCIFRQNA